MKIIIYMIISNQNSCFKDFIFEMRVEELKLNTDYLNFVNERNPIIELYI